MPTLEYLNFSGIYAIINLINDKMYIGSSKNIKSRFKTHTRDLNKNKHFNPYLQNAWNKYGGGNFTIEVIEYIKNNKLREKEIYYINFYKSLYSQTGYNILDKTYNTNNIQSKYWEFLNPDGKLIKIHNLFAFCNENKLNYSCMWKLYQGEVQQHQGWMSTNKAFHKSRFGKEFSLVSPDGKIYKGKNIALFCRENELSDHFITMVVRGDIEEYKGWRIATLDRDLTMEELDSFYLNKTHHNGVIRAFISPEGKLEVVHNLTYFCEKHNLSKQVMKFVYHGTNRYKSHKGWTSAKHLTVTTL